MNQNVFVAGISVLVAKFLEVLISMKMARILFLCFTVAFSGFASAAVHHTTLKQVGAATEQYGMVVFEDPTDDKPECAEQFTIFSFDKSTQHGQDMFSIALTALVAQKRVAVTYSDSDCGLWGIRGLITRIDILSD